MGFFLDILLWDGNILTNSFAYVTLVWSSDIQMFNLSLKRKIGGSRASLRAGQKDQMLSQVRKVLGQRDQGLILMVKG